jgi:3-hydroxyisobutyrate dehydrogenase-like beta-hydroxyacid dehydrogenase
MSEQSIGVVGLGDMGAAMANAMLSAGLEIVVHDIRQGAADRLVEHGAQSASSLTEVAESCSIVSIVVLNDAQVQTVVNELATVAKPGTILIVHSTVQPSTVIDLADAHADRQIHVIDAAVSGGSEKGSIGALSVMIGGPDEIVARCQPVFDAISADAFHVGPVGAGVAAKVVNNLLSLGYYALQIEAMQIANSFGIDEDTIATVVTASQGDSRGMRTWGRMDRIRRRRLSGASGRDDRSGPRVYDEFSKDLVTAAKVAGHRGLVLPLTAATASLLPSHLMARDAELDRRGPDIKIPRCSSCSQELAAPFRSVGTHPECR